MASQLSKETFAYAERSEMPESAFRENGRGDGLSRIRSWRLPRRGALIRYLTDTQKNALKHITNAEPYNDGRFMALDRVALHNLELVSNTRGGNRKGTLLWILDKTSTAMGSRLLRSWIERPLMDADEIARRQDAIENLIQNPMSADSIREELSDVHDVERLLSRIAYDAVNCARVSRNFAQRSKRFRR